MTPEELKQFDEMFPNNYTNYDMWQSVNQERKKMIDFISSIIATREREWTEEKVKMLEDVLDKTDIDAESIKYGTLIMAIALIQDNKQK